MNNQNLTTFEPALTNDYLELWATIDRTVGRSLARRASDKLIQNAKSGVKNQADSFPYPGWVFDPEGMNRHRHRKDFGSLKEATQFCSDLRKELVRSGFPEDCIQTKIEFLERGEDVDAAHEVTYHIEFPVISSEVPPIESHDDNPLKRA